ncbi:MAG: tRNA uridine-5-carboxymethylaminomethyl(34) synthesis GTPase MnmE [Gammaproteobacteria bacterium]|jgi:tRNA modification GTPase
MADYQETIAAIATPPGRGGIGVIRLSGPAVPAIAETLFGRLPAARTATLTRVRDAAGETLDEIVALYFEAPRSFTGEHVLELQGHGGPVVLDMILGRVLELGARLARPGEFTLRAYLNDKLDLAQAEAVADLIDSGSRVAARSAMHSLQGVFSERVEALHETLIGLRTHIEACLDFAEEEIDFLADAALNARLQDAVGQLDRLLAGARQGRLLREGLQVVILGRPNAGKSSLLNYLSGHNSAIVTEIPGTTRDVLREQIEIDGLPIHIIDTAGLRDSADPVEQEGIRRAWDEVSRADLVLILIDDVQGVQDIEQTAVQRVEAAGVAVLQVFNKVDLSSGASGERPDGLGISARTGIGMPALYQRIKALAHYGGGEEGLFIARRRHLDALQQTGRHLQAAVPLLQQGSGELAAEELRLAHEALGEITGRFSADDLLGRIFSTFCIGK